MAQSFTQKLIEIDVALDPDPQTNASPFFTSGVSGKPNSNSITISGSRASVRVQYAGVPQLATAQISVYGLSPSLMDQLSTLGIVFQLVPKNTITIRAGDANTGLATVFIGTIRHATADFNRAPDVPFTFECYAGWYNNVAPSKASSYPQPTDVGTIVAAVALEMGYGFENNGVGPGNKFGVTLPPSYFPGSSIDQLKAAADHAGVIVDLVPGATGLQILAIWPKGGSRNLNVVPLVSSSTGMIGYPSYSQVGLEVKTLYNPQIAIGGQIQIQSSLPKATGTWIVIRVDHALDTLVRDGLWESSISCFNPKYAGKTGIPVA